jgi:hypothetical protein
VVLELVLSRQAEGTRGYHDEGKGGRNLGPPYLQFAALCYAFRFSVAFRFEVYQSDASSTRHWRRIERL